MMKQEELLDKYYRGETTAEEEQELRAYFWDTENDIAEKDMFGYFRNESFVPNDLEESISSGLTEKQNKSKILKIKILSIVSIAASIVVFLSIFLSFQAKEKARIENNFFVMEQALFQVSESIQPAEQEEMLVIWVDDEVEIIIN